MVSLKKIRNLIKQYQNRNFRSEVTREKNQKYLFRDEKVGNRRKSWNIFRKDGERISPFSRFIQDKIYISPSITSNQQAYLRYIGLFLIFASGYIMLYSPYFLISPSKVLIEGLDEGIDISVAYRSIEDLYGENIFFIDEAKIASSLQRYQKNISLIRIDRLYPNNLKILISAYPILFDIDIPSVRGKTWGMTENGILVPRETEKKSLYNLVYIDESLNNDILLEYNAIMKESQVQIVKKTLEFFGSTWPNLKLEKVLYLRKENEIHLMLNNKTIILFTLQDFTKKIGETPTYNHLRLQLITLKTFIDTHTADIEKGLYTYLDARVPGKIFSCKEAILCTSNINTIYPDITRVYE